MSITVDVKGSMAIVLISPCPVSSSICAAGKDMIVVDLNWNCPEPQPCSGGSSTPIRLTIGRCELLEGSKVLGQTKVNGEAP